MKKLYLIIICLPIIVFAQPSYECNRSKNKQFKDSVVEIMFTLVNQHRVSHNLHKLKWCNKIQKSCLSHSKYMAYQSLMTHTEKNKSNPYYTGAHSWHRTGLDMCGENVLVGYQYSGRNAKPWMYVKKKDIKNAKELAISWFVMWKESPGHNENMLDKRWNYMAFDYYGFVDVPSEYYDKMYATQLFR